MGGILAKLRDIFFSTKMEIALVGLENSGKTTFCNYLSMGKHVEEPPTVGLNVKVMQRGGVKIKVWDLAGKSYFVLCLSHYSRSNFLFHL